MNPFKIQTTKIQVPGACLETTGAYDVKQLILDETVPSFPDEVKFMSDIPASWFWVVLQKHAKVPISLAMISQRNEKGKKAFSQSIIYLPGLNKQP